MSSLISGGPGSFGIQTLLQAEKKASEVVQNARKQKLQKLKQAKEEADAEIQQFKTAIEQEFSQCKESHMGSSDQTSQKFEQDTKRLLDELAQQVKHHENEVIDMLLQYVAKVDLTLHPNVEYYK